MKRPLPQSVRVDMECMKQLLNNGITPATRRKLLMLWGPQPQAAVVMADPVTGGAGFGGEENTAKEPGLSVICAPGSWLS